MSSFTGLSLANISSGNQFVISGPSTGASLQVVTTPVNVTAEQLVVTSEPTYSGAIATATLSGNSVGPITVTAGGSGYFTTPPAVTFEGGGLPSIPAAGVATLNAAGQVVGVTVNGGILSIGGPTTAGAGYSAANPPRSRSRAAAAAAPRGAPSSTRARERSSGLT